MYLAYLRQAGKCAHCGLYFGVEDKLEVDYIYSRVRGGKDGYKTGSFYMLTVTTRKLSKMKNCDG